MLEGYVFDSDSANTEGIFSENTEDIYFITEKANFISQLLLNMSILENIKYPVDH